MARLVRRGRARLVWARLGTARQAWKQTTDDHETSFVIMNKRPLKRQRMKRPFRRCFLLTLDNLGKVDNDKRFLFVFSSHYSKRNYGTESVPKKKDS